jgi:hypothetical protein
MLRDGGSFSIPAGATVNVFAGQTVEFFGGAQPGVMRLLCTSDGPGLTMAMTQNVGSQQTAPVSPGTTVNVASAAGAGPKDDEDTVLPAVPMPVGIRSALNITNTTAGAIPFRYAAIVAP